MQNESGFWVEFKESLNINSPMDVVWWIMIVLNMTLLYFFWRYAMNSGKENEALADKMFKEETERVEKTIFIAEDQSEVLPISLKFIFETLIADQMGSVTGKNRWAGKAKTIFLVCYKDGTSTYRKVENRSRYYDLYESKLEK